MKSIFSKLLFVVFIFLSLTHASTSQAANYTVNVFDDPSPVAPPNGCASSGRCSLREAVLSANVSGDVSSTITLPAGSYTLTISGSDNTGFAGDLDILTHDLTINGAGANNTSINATAINDRIFDIPSDASSINVILSGITLTGGNVTGNGGAVEFVNNGGDTLILNNMALNNNKASANGGGLSATGVGTVTFNNSTLSNNQATVVGGATHSDTTTRKINNTTISGNQSSTNAGAMNATNGSAIILRNATISNNTATNSGGGISFGFSANVNIANSILVGNTAASNLNCNAGTAPGAFTSADYNMFGDMGNCTVAGATTHDQNSLTGAGLQSLGNYGGPTQTQLLMSNSDAINKGNPAGCQDTAGAVLTSDQRGQTRPASTACDVGATELGTSDLSITNSASSSSLNSGSNVTYTIKVTNSGPNNNMLVTLTDTFSGSASNTFVSATPDNGSSCSNSSGTITCSLGQINNGSSVTTTVTVTAASSGTLTNTATVAGTEIDSNSGNNSASVNVNVSGSSGGSGGCSLQKRD